MTREHEFEPVYGLPESLPEGEKILWQGAPDWRAFAMQVFHVKAIAIYGAVLCAWRLVTVLYDGYGIAAAFSSAFSIALLMALAVGLFCLLAWLIERTTAYTITNRRLVLRIGVALSITINIPFKIIASAGCRSMKDGTGNIALTLQGTNKIAYAHLWPHARPWRFARPEPTLRAVRDVERVSAILADALGQAVLNERRTQSAREAASTTPAPLVSAAE